MENSERVALHPDQAAAPLAEGLSSRLSVWARTPLRAILLIASLLAATMAVAMLLVRLIGGPLPPG